MKSFAIILLALWVSDVVARTVVFALKGKIAAEGGLGVVLATHGMKGILDALVVFLCAVMVYGSLVFIAMLHT